MLSPGSAVLGGLIALAAAIPLYLLVRPASRARRGELFQALFEQSPDALYVLDDGGGFVDANAAGLALLGVSRSALTGLRFPDLIVAEHNETAVRGWPVLGAEGLRGRAIVSAGPGGGEGGKGGARRDVEFRVRHGVRPGRHLALVRDLGRERVLEEQLAHAQRMESLGRLAGGVAHDFNNILTAILGHSEMLMDDLPEGSALRGDLGEIHSAALRAATLTRQLLAFSRRQVMSPRVVDLGEVVRGLEPMLRRVIGEDVVLAITCDRALAVRADTGQIENVVVNLAVNARDAMPAGGQLGVRVARETVHERDGAGPGEELAVGAYAVLTVSDTGHGMAPDVLEHVFEPFFTTKERGRGSGLGLSTVYGVVSQSGGAVRVESRPGQGSTFRVFLPLVAATPDARPIPPPRPAAAGTETVLLVEDEDSVRALARRGLESRGYRVLAAAGGTAALELAARHNGPIHLLVSDVVMPGMSGPQLADALRRVRPRVKVVYVSGYAEDALGQRGLPEGDAFLAKPFSADDLAARVRSVLDAGP